MKPSSSARAQSSAKLGRVKLALGFALAVIVACHAPPPLQRDASAEPSSACTKLGATCTFSPGKLGTCVEVEQTSGAATFVCQSQH